MARSLIRTDFYVNILLVSAPGLMSLVESRMLMVDRLSRGQRQESREAIECLPDLLEGCAMWEQRVGTESALTTLQQYRVDTGAGGKAQY